MTNKNIMRITLMLLVLPLLAVASLHGYVAAHRRAGSVTTVTDTVTVTVEATTTINTAVKSTSSSRAPVVIRICVVIFDHPLTHRSHLPLSSSRPQLLLTLSRTLRK
jgi:hypothetical protein